MKRTLLATVLLVLLIGRSIQAGPVIQTAAQLASSSISWTYQQIFTRYNVPLPASAVGMPGAYVAAVYSPSVVNFQGKYRMIFGVSIDCRYGRVKRDSVAVAYSSDGTNFQFDKYLIEPDMSTCLVDPLNWAYGARYQINDPYAFTSADGNYLYVMYTAVSWLFPLRAFFPWYPDPITAAQIQAQSGGADWRKPIECGTLGMAIFTSNWGTIQRNDFYLTPSTGANCNLEAQGFSRPTLRRLSNGTNQIWFDTSGNVRKINMGNNVNQLYDRGAGGVALVTGVGLPERIGLADIDVPNLGGTDTLFLANSNPGIWAQSRSSDTAAWSSANFLTKKTGLAWDNGGHSSPNLYIKRDTCKPRLYFSGIQIISSTPLIQELSIAVATPPASQTFKFPICSQ